MKTKEIGLGKNAAIIAVVNAPQVSLAENEEAGELLMHFYAGLGWNRDDFLDPRKVRTSEDIYNRLFNQMRERCPDSLGIGMFMVNKGPGVDNSVPPGKVHLLEGWITPVHQEALAA